MSEWDERAFHTLVWRAFFVLTYLGNTAFRKWGLRLKK